MLTKMIKAAWSEALELVAVKGSHGMDFRKRYPRRQETGRPLSEETKIWSLYYPVQIAPQTEHWILFTRFMVLSRKRKSRYSASNQTIHRILVV
jgi:hypothetical protein